jgi:hypothetical protein
MPDRRRLFPLDGRPLAVAALGIVTVFGVLLSFTHQGAVSCLPPVPGQAAPYPPSPLIQSITWDFGGLIRRAPGSDLWPTTWADDDNLYASWGDGGGFGGTNRAGRVGLGVARIEGTAENFVGYNVFGGGTAEVQVSFTGKSNGMLSIDGTLYMSITEEGRWLRLKIGRSIDHGRTWTFKPGDRISHAGWDFAEPDGAFSDLTFLTFGRDYQGARDSYVYAYSAEDRAKDPDGTRSKDIGMFRVPKDQIVHRRAYEYFMGLDGGGRPRWTPDITKRQPVFNDPNGVGWGVRVTYSPGLDRYLLTAWHGKSGGWGIFDAPEPWGPWSTAAYYDCWIDPTFKFGFTFPQKWMSADAKTMHMIFSGTGVYDSFNVIKATLTRRQVE